MLFIAPPGRIWLDIAPDAGYIALGAIVLQYALLNLLDKKIYEHAFKVNQEKK